MMPPRSANDRVLNAKMLSAGYPSLCVLTFLQLARRFGADLGNHLGGITEEELERGRPSVPWPEALHFFDELIARLSEEQQHALVREYMTTLPFFRALTPFMASVTSFLTLVWRGSRGVTMPLDSRYDVHEAEHELYINLNELGSEGLGFLQISGFIAVHGPLAMGAPSLELRSWSCKPYELHVRVSAPVELSSEARLAAATNAPVTNILKTIELLGPASTGAMRDGHLVFPNQQGADIVELSSDWAITPTEARVALALAEGNRPSEIAKELSIAVGTVRVHLKHLYAKTETANQRELAQRVAHWRSR